VTAEELCVPRGLENSIIDFLHNLYDHIGWFGVFLAMVIESAAIPLPSEVIMPLAGWFLIKDVGHSVWFVLVAGVIGALGNVVGSAITYWIGARGGRPLLLRYGKYILINPHHIDMADRWFAEKGEATAFFSRLLPIVRTFISLPAGIARMNFGKFMLYTFLGALPWSAALALGGYVAGANWENFRNKMRPFDYPVAAIVVILLVVFVVRGRQTRSRVPAEVGNE
jgi:membrane protein DedA with SNARE-associated domain